LSNGNSFDLIVLGSGPAGEKGAAQAAYFGKKVALVEKESVFGGAATNTGTIPSKTLRETAVFLSGFRHRELEGIDCRGLKEDVSVGQFLRRAELVKQRERSRIGDNLQRHGITTFRGHARFRDANTVAIRYGDGSEICVSGDIFLIATGSRPYRPPQFSLAEAGIFDSDSILHLAQIPRRMLVNGGGVIGCEYACMFAELGVDVAIVEKRDRIVGFLDREIGEALLNAMRRIGIRVLTGHSLEEFRREEDSLVVHLNPPQVMRTDAILLSSGRVGNTDDLGLESLGIAVDRRGRIEVDGNYRTTVPHIYAAGDVIGEPALASTAMQQARLAMVHAFNLHYLNAMPTVLPFGIYTIPECSMAGETEEGLLEKSVPFVAGRARYSQNARGQITGDCTGFLKLLFHKEDMRLLGVHIIGEQATELVHVGLMSLSTASTADVFINSCYNYPTLTELYKYAAYDALGRRNQGN
jgi:NAD(P) transhydrogenase